MSDSKTLKLLLVEDDLEDEQLLSEALLEIEENRQWCTWRSSAVIAIDGLADALDCLHGDSFDAVLLNLSLPDSPSMLNTFLEVSAVAGNTPVLVLADEADEHLAKRLLREGAQDILIKSELECAPLARAIRYAIERQRRATASRACAFLDDLTGVLTRPAFINLASQYLALPLRANAQLLLAFIDIPADPENRDLLQLEIAEALTKAFGPPSLIGLCSRNRFCILTPGLSESAVQSALERFSSELSSTVQFSVTPIDAPDDLERIVARDIPLRAKTAILSD